jgi:type 1 glutamine amidotransferase
MRWILPVLIAVSVCHAGDPPVPQESPVRVLVAVGGHTEAPSFFSVFDGYPELSAVVTQHPEAFASDFRKKYDVVVLYDMLSDLSEPERQHLKEFVESGKGVVSLHWAVLDYDAWPWWHQEVVGGKFIRPVNGEKVTQFKNDVDMVLRPVGQHPITAGIGPLHLVDEAYKKLWVSPKVHALLETESPDSDRVVAWVSPYEKSKVVYIQAGHAPSTYANPAYRKLVRNAILWSAGKLR